MYQLLDSHSTHDTVPPQSHDICETYYVVCIEEADVLGHDKATVRAQGGSRSEALRILQQDGEDHQADSVGNTIARHQGNPYTRVSATKESEHWIASALITVFSESAI